MVSTKDKPGPFDGMERAQPGEPVFTLRAHDVLAPALVREWVDRKRALITSTDMPDEQRETELRQASEADRVAEAMDDWRLGRVDIEAPAPDPEPAPSYSGNSMDEAELAARDRFNALVAAAQKMDNAATAVGEALEIMEPLRFDTTVWFKQIQAACVRAADRVRPKRRSYAHLTDSPVA